MTLDEIADAIVRDLHEPDKLIGLSHNLRRMAMDLRDVRDWASTGEGDAKLRLIQAREILNKIAGES